MDKATYMEMYLNEDLHWWFVARRMIIRNILSYYLPVERKRRILEVGCGTGGNLELLSTYGNIHAMELDEEAIVMADKRGLCHVVKGSLPDDIPFEYSFDLICMLDVLEHIDDDLRALESVRKRLNPDGKVLITVPAFEFLRSEHDVALHHKRRYVKKQLMRLVQRSGFRIIYHTYYNILLFPIIAGVRSMKKIKGGECRTDVTMPSKPINSILTAIFSGERFFMPWISLPFGTSILILAEK
ncbi:MAG: class I SAM-dependent methyltransferase [Desulfobacteraceae bacterium]|nr:MAG: class I SAM-dependent methyltransferase [Desulfobacteraceae bacterium]